MLQGIIYLVRTQIFRKINIAYPLICTRTCEYHWVRNISSSENFAYALNKWSPKKKTSNIVSNTKDAKDVEN